MTDPLLQVRPAAPSELPAVGELTVAAYRARLRDDLDLDALAVGLVEVVGEAVEPSDARLWLRPQPGVQR